MNDNTNENITVNISKKGRIIFFVVLSFVVVSVCVLVAGIMGDWLGKNKKDTFNQTRNSDCVVAIKRISEAGGIYSGITKYVDGDILNTAIIVVTKSSFESLNNTATQVLDTIRLYVADNEPFTEAIIMYNDQVYNIVSTFLNELSKLEK